MQAHNLCYTTLVRPKEVAQLDPSTYKTSPTGNVFVKPSVRRGILPDILDELLAARKRAKADMKVEKDPLRKAVLNGRQVD